MVTLMKNTMLEKIREAGALTDVDLYKNMTKEGNIIPEDRLNKMLLDLEILGLVKVAWVTKDERRIEASEDETEYNQGTGNGRGGTHDAASYSTGSGPDSREKHTDTSYEASFPGLEK